mmetsp:Transcript_78746/g.218837  ORF Transcript_78746/g.218837 Transcript_78746/m.218837 type:complete len:301 (-) Transcript_78746:609-1511(-)
MELPSRYSSSLSSTYGTIECSGTPMSDSESSMPAPCAPGAARLWVIYSPVAERVEALRKVCPCDAARRGPASRYQLTISESLCRLFGGRSSIVCNASASNASCVSGPGASISSPAGSAAFSTSASLAAPCPTACVESSAPAFSCFLDNRKELPILPKTPESCRLNRLAADGFLAGTLAALPSNVRSSAPSRCSSPCNAAPLASNGFGATSSSSAFEAPEDSCTKRMRSCTSSGLMTLTIPLAEETFTAPAPTKMPWILPSAPARSRTHPGFQAPVFLLKINTLSPLRNTTALALLPSLDD